MMGRKIQVKTVIRGFVKKKENRNGAGSMDMREDCNDYTIKPLHRRGSHIIMFSLIRQTSPCGGIYISIVLKYGNWRSP